MPITNNMEFYLSIKAVNIIFQLISTALGKSEPNANSKKLKNVMRLKGLFVKKTALH